ncbi:hypothetical protein K227x_11320 [Rubripirellula lacrimiformis]|uniref:Uncharacterized protein n=1 Tax=Rubripirellula lacrimiformis TaxID=1930273 RepID=A0A517N6I2_9BACT|nr:thioredoxin family protein [Rubripirellula lacrimiformis]QDT02754.1 hypothetical protein K227x_11320 [Rubripirellula lacrimiformis]
MKRFMVIVGLGIVISLASAQAGWAEMPQRASTTVARYPTQQSEIRPTISWHTSLESGWAESRRRNVPMVIYITTDPCKYCNAMKNDTWRDRSVQQDLAGDFVAIELSPEQNSSTLHRIKIDAYPTTLIGVPEGKIIASRQGYQPAAAMKSLLREAKHLIINRR